MARVDAIIDAQLRKLEKIEPDQRAITELTQTLNTDLFQKARELIDTATVYSSAALAYKELEKITGLLRQSVEVINQKIPQLQEDSTKKVREIHRQVLEALKELEDSRLLNISGVDFKSTVVFQTVKTDDFKIGVRDVSGIKQVRNPEKDKTYHWFQFIGRVKQAIVPDTISFYEEKYSLPVYELRAYVNSIQSEYDSCVSKAKADAKKDVEYLKKQAGEKIEIVRSEIKAISQRIESLERDMDMLVEAGAAPERKKQLERYMNLISKTKSCIEQII